jgi:hypothetical protein
VLASIDAPCAIIEKLSSGLDHSPDIQSGWRVLDNEQRAIIDIDDCDNQSLEVGARPEGSRRQKSDHPDVEFVKATDRSNRESECKQREIQTRQPDVTTSLKVDHPSSRELLLDVHTPSEQMNTAAAGPPFASCAAPSRHLPLAISFSVILMICASQGSSSTLT